MSDSNTAHPSNAYAVLMLGNTWFQEIKAGLRFSYCRHANRLWIAALATSFAAFFAAVFGQEQPTVLMASGLAALTVSGAYAVRLLTPSQRDAKPEFIMAAMRALEAADFRQFLAHLNTVTLRGERTPIAENEVVRVYHEFRATNAERKRTRDRKRAEAAQVQAALIDAFLRQ